ncbi:NNMT/PNMT/TEMT family protein [Oesophagostomum dentatum]|uniref:NNMT/PNMT/TEMT family protein n=1 Tax=Oesophagostomum dentatum TaxID=61180 RepID=A0A0B1SF21_OESDE|nr:NNMT/PNMT/TEMT family protein [Oesophagostomum dentatum]
MWETVNVIKNFFLAGYLIQALGFLLFYVYFLGGFLQKKNSFDPNAYLESFYKTASEDTAMQIVLFFLPGILYRLPRPIRTVLDLGAGPTVYIPIALRNQALQIFTSDYAQVNRDVLQSWIEDRWVVQKDTKCK